MPGRRSNDANPAARAPQEEFSSFHSQEVKTWSSSSLLPIPRRFSTAMMLLRRTLQAPHTPTRSGGPAPATSAPATKTPYDAQALARNRRTPSRAGRPVRLQVANLCAVQGPSLLSARPARRTQPWTPSTDGIVQCRFYTRSIGVRRRSQGCFWNLQRRNPMQSQRRQGSEGNTRYQSFATHMQPQQPKPRKMFPPVPAALAHPAILKHGKDFMQFGGHKLPERTSDASSA